YVEVDAQAVAIAQVSREPLERGPEAEVVESRRTEVGDELARALEYLAYAAAHVVEERSQRVRRLLRGAVEVHGEPDEHLADAVVQVDGRRAPRPLFGLRQLLRVGAQAFLLDAK